MTAIEIINALRAASELPDNAFFAAVADYIDSHCDIENFADRLPDFLEAQRDEPEESELGSSEPTPEQKAAYLKSRGARCLYCQSDELDADGAVHADHDIDVVTSKVTCCVCDRTWTDVFTLSDVVLSD